MGALAKTDSTQFRCALATTSQVYFADDVSCMTPLGYNTKGTYKCRILGNSINSESGADLLYPLDLVLSQWSAKCFANPVKI